MEIDLNLFQWVILPMLVVTLSWLAYQSGQPIKMARELLLLSVLSWAGEQTCIEFYGFYSYSDDWWLKLGHVPIFIPIIWPVVIKSSAQLAKLWLPSSKAPLVALLGALLVLLDASWIEIISVNAGFWSWFEPGYFGVPPVGIVGWGVFAFFILWGRPSLELGSGVSVLNYALKVLGGLHLSLLTLWWGLFRWFGRGDLPESSVIVFGIYALMLTFSFGLHKKQIPLGPNGIRVLAATTFFWILIQLQGSPNAKGLLWHTAVLVLFYCFALIPKRARE